MNLIVDLHVHSHYSRATSKRMNLEGMYYWGKLKGINVIGTGDFTHPAWFSELKQKLEPAEDGLFKLKSEFAKAEDKNLPASVRDNPIRFILTVEISNIYRRADQVRKLHNVVVVPDFKTAAKINAKLAQVGNLKADGRPILGLDSAELLKITLDSNPDSLFFPAHIWTPWFAMFGSKSGFESVTEAFGDLAGEIRAVETGLSSDPAMNWRVGDLDGRTLVSNSDAHSPEKLGREANVFACKLSYQEIIKAIKLGSKDFVGTIEFFPQEGKYHFDGHRACKFSCSPVETKQLKGLCPKCGKPLVLGVDYQVENLATRKLGGKPQKTKQVEYIIPLAELLAQLRGVKSTKSKAVEAEYLRIISELGDEFSLLRQVELKQISELGSSELAEAIRRMRAGQIHIEPGYDGEYGVIKIFNKNKGRQQSVGQQSLRF